MTNAVEMAGSILDASTINPAASGIKRLENKVSLQATTPIVPTLSPYTALRILATSLSRIPGIHFGVKAEVSTSGGEPKCDFRESGGRVR
jgi:hypothetical protein